MADDSIIDLETSVKNNEIVLNNGYTISPNLVFGGEDNILDNVLLSRTKDALTGAVTFIFI